MYSNTEFLSEFSIDNFDLIRAYSYFSKYTALKRGNKKLGKNILNFNLPPVKSCMNAESCKADCYAVKSYRMYPTVRNYQDIMQFFALNDLDTLQNKIESELSNPKKWFEGVVRIHSSGDFITQNYLNMWIDISKKFPHIKFYAYTKVNNILNFSNTPKNLNIINSFVNGKLNFGKLEYVKKLRAESKGIICPPTRGKDLTCEECKYCFDKKKPLFVIH